MCNTINDIIVEGKSVLLNNIISNYFYVVFLCLSLGAITYKYFLEIHSPRKLAIALLKYKLVILLVAAVELLIILMIVQFILFCFLSMTTLGHLIYIRTPEYISVFLFGAWIEGAKEYYIFCLETSIYLTIGCSFFEYSILKEKRKNVNSERQIVKAVLYSNIPVFIIVFSYFIYLYHTNPALFQR